MTNFQSFEGIATSTTYPSMLATSENTVENTQLPSRIHYIYNKPFFDNK